MNEQVYGMECDVVVGGRCWHKSKQLRKSSSNNVVASTAPAFFSHPLCHFASLPVYQLAAPPLPQFSLNQGIYLQLQIDAGGVGKANEKYANSRSIAIQLDAISAWARIEQFIHTNTQIRSAFVRSPEWRV